jgi:hypothetical protein
VGWVREQAVIDSCIEEKREKKAIVPHKRGQPVVKTREKGAHLQFHVSSDLPTRRIHLFTISPSIISAIFEERNVLIRCPTRGMKRPVVLSCWSAREMDVTKTGC